MTPHEEDSLSGAPAHHIAKPHPSLTTDVRLQFRESSVGSVDGAWWPRSLDLTRELPNLVRFITGTGFEVHRVVYNDTGWEYTQRRLWLDDRVIKLAGHQAHERASLSLIDISGEQSIVLVVVPPDATDAFAHRVFAIMRQLPQPARPAQILELAEASG